MTPLLIVVLGPTAVGKTELTLSLAEKLHCPILNCDSRQIYRDMYIGTAAPTEEQKSRAKHYFVGELGLDDYYSAAKYESDVLNLTSELFKTHNALILSGGSMMYMNQVNMQSHQYISEYLLHFSVAQQGITFCRSYIKSE